MNFDIISFYYFVNLENYYDMKTDLLDCCNALNIKGTILLADEGINATISGDNAAIESFLLFLRSDIRLSDIRPCYTAASSQPFAKMKVRLKKEAVSLGVDAIDLQQRGEYVAPEHWDDLLSDPKVMLIDNRNTYEIERGTFTGAINPQNETFREFPEWATNWSVDKMLDTQKVAMFCTGGIRCEKSTAFMKSLGFKQVFHLKGGIISYLQKTKNKSGLWQGDCFVFDDRIILDENLNPKTDIKCLACNEKVNSRDLLATSRGHVLCANCKGQKAQDN